MKKSIVFFSRPGSAWNTEKPMWEQNYWDDHTQFIDALFNSGKIIQGGPFSDGSGSMVIFAADSVEEVRELMKGDPWGQRQILVEDDIKEWTIFLNASEKKST